MCGNTVYDFDYKHGPGPCMNQHSLKLLHALSVGVIIKLICFSSHL